MSRSAGLPPRPVRGAPSRAMGRAPSDDGGIRSAQPMPPRFWRPADRIELRQSPWVGLKGRRGEAPEQTRAAFSLIELLLVIGLFLTLMGIAVASVVRAPRLNRLIAAEQVISDAIRQARHTARTTGQPVVLRVRKDTRSISGLVSQPLWHGTEGWPGQAVAGVTGGGLKASSVAAVDQHLLWSMSGDDLRGGSRLWSGSTTRRASILLSAAVRPPRAIPTLVGTQEPIVVVGEAGTLPVISVVQTGNVYDPANSQWPQCGLMLECTSVNGNAPSWEFIGWFGTDHGKNRIEISTVDHQVMESVDSSASTATAQAPLICAGGAWYEISMLVEPEAITLYRDGRRVARRQILDFGSVDLAEPLQETMAVGIVDFNGTTTVASSIIDNVRLDRMGDAMSGTLPAGIILGNIGNELRISCHPSGRVESSSASLEISSQADATRATLTIDGSGNVTSTVTP